MRAIADGGPLQMLIVVGPSSGRGSSAQEAVALRLDMAKLEAAGWRAVVSRAI